MSHSEENTPVTVKDIKEVLDKKKLPKIFNQIPDTPGCIVVKDLEPGSTMTLFFMIP